ncbi:MAG: hypothetical protein Q4B70_18055 [Lachnospiraceae bacterium]|nr:hypothetical protein [Lachnospiraceae bacterium]
MKKKIFLAGLIACMLFVLCGCTQTVEDTKMTLDLNGIGEREGVYTGEVKEELPNGEGKFITENEEGVEWYYEGSWVNGQMEGTGCQVWDELGQKHEGNYKDSHYEGKGKWYENDVLIYEGNFVNDLYDGKGKLLNANGDTVYEGKFKAGVPTNQDAVRNSAKSVSFDDLARDEMAYYGDIVSVSGEIIQVLEGEDGYAEYRLALNDDWSDVVFLSYQRPEGEVRIIEGDVITIYGISTGLYTYESTSGADITVPYVNMLCR